MRFPHRAILGVEDLALAWAQFTAPRHLQCAGFPKALSGLVSGSGL